MPDPFVLFLSRLPMAALVHCSTARPCFGGRNGVDKRRKEISQCVFVVPYINIGKNDIDVMQDFHSSNRIYNFAAACKFADQALMMLYIFLHPQCPVIRIDHEDKLKPLQRVIFICELGDMSSNSFRSLTEANIYLTVLDVSEIGICEDTGFDNPVIEVNVLHHVTFERSVCVQKGNCFVIDLAASTKNGRIARK